MPYRILLIDDSITQLEMLKSQFQSAGYEVFTAKDGAEAYKSVFTVAPDLIVSDILMPNLNGYQLCRLLKNNPLTKKIPIVLLTVLDKKIDKFWANKSGAEKFMSKTASFNEINESVLNLIQSHPINQEYKTAVLNNSGSTESIQDQINTILDELLMNATFLNEFRDLGEFLSHDSMLIEKIFKLISSFMDYNVAGIFFRSLDKNEKNIIHLDINKQPVSTFVIEKIKRDFFASMPGISEFSVRDFDHVIFREKVETEQKILNSEEFKSCHITPILFSGKLLGGICFYNMNECDYKEFSFYETMINELLLLLKMKHLYNETEYLSMTDGLTGLYNRRHFDQNVEREFLRVKRYPAELSISLVDIDFFKKVNDTYGHQFGDFVLKEIAEIISSSFRKTDMIFRYGGEELATILPGTSLENAKIPLERVREKIEAHKFIFNGEEASITVSIGISANKCDVPTSMELVKCADKALYKAKQDGRNQVVAYSYDECNKILQ